VKTRVVVKVVKMHYYLNLLVISNPSQCCYLCHSLLPNHSLSSSSLCYLLNAFFFVAFFLLFCKSLEFTFLLLHEEMYKLLTLIRSVNIGTKMLGHLIRVDLVLVIRPANLVIPPAHRLLIQALLDYHASQTHQHELAGWMMWMG
jgi:hypothetical protein